MWPRIRRTFEDPTGFARIDGNPALALENQENGPFNIIENGCSRARADRRGSATARNVFWGTKSTYADESEQVETMPQRSGGEFVSPPSSSSRFVIVWALGIRSALLVGLRIPRFRFLSGCDRTAGRWATQ